MDGRGSSLITCHHSYGALSFGGPAAESVASTKYGLTEEPEPGAPEQAKRVQGGA
ncbi:unnamed protein product, partial [Amoebophrya sp. A25]